MSSSASTLFSHKLSDFAPWNQDNDANIDGDVVLFIDDSLLTSYHHSGAFAMDSLLLKYCRSSNYKIILLLTGQSSSHYQSILMKNLLDVHAMHAAGRLECVRLVSDFPDLSSSSELPWLASNPLAPGKAIAKSWTQDMSWKDLVSWQQYQLSGVVSGSAASANLECSETDLKTIIFIDDLDAFELLAPSPAAGRDFIQQYLRTVSRQSSNCIFSSLVTFGRIRDYEETTLNSLAIAAGSDSTSGGRLSSLHFDSQEPLLVSYMLARAQWIILAAALRTGLSSLVHGTLTVQHLDLFSDKPGKKKQVLQYRALDSGVQCVSSE